MSHAIGRQYSVSLIDNIMYHVFKPCLSTISGRLRQPCEFGVVTNGYLSKLPKERDAPSRINAHTLSVFESSACAPALALALALVLAPEVKNVINMQ